jgi:hypothetical protein
VASLLDLLANPMMLQQFRNMLPQSPDAVVSAKPQTGANMSVDPRMARGMQNGANSQNAQLQDPTIWNMSGQAQSPDYRRMTAPGNPGGPSYQMPTAAAQGMMPNAQRAPYLKRADLLNALATTLGRGQSA